MTVSNVKSYSYDPVIAGKNFVINGSFDFWNRSLSPSTSVYAGSGTYIADRWTPHQFQSSRVSRVSVTPGSGPSSRFAMRVGSASLSDDAGGARMVIAQEIEDINSIILRNQTVTLSFWIRFSASQFLSIANSTQSSFGNFGYMLGYFSSSSNPPLGSTAFDATANGAITNGSLPTVWTRYTITAKVPSNTNNVAVRFGFDNLGSTTSSDGNWYEITDVQVEENNFATNFSFAGGNSIEELRLCQRYYYRTTASQVFSPIGFGFASSTTNAMIYIQFPVQMRTGPSLIGFSTLQINDAVTGYTVTAVGYSGTEFGPTGATLICTTSGLTQFRPCKLLANNSTNSYIDFSAEL